MSNVKDISTAEFAQEVMQRSHELPVVVDFWAAWCGPCKVLGPILERLADEHDGDFQLVKVDVDQNQQLSAQFGVQGIPTVIGFRNGQPVARFTGALPEAAVREWLGTLLPSPVDLLVDQARDAALAGDEAGAEDLFRRALEADAHHVDAGTGLASLLIARGETEEALITLGKLSPTAEVERLQAAARVSAAQGSDIADLEAVLGADPGNEDTRLELGRALIAKGEYEPGLDHLLALVAARGAKGDDARQAMLDAFDLLGAGHPLTTDYRRRLASALF